MASSSAPPDYRTLIAATSLIAGPLLMAIGDLLHPEERMAAHEQIPILVDHAARWYTAHLLLFVGIILFIPGLLALSAIAGARKPAAGYASRILVLVGTAALASIFMFSGPMVAAVGPAMLAFFAGTAVFALPLTRAGGRAAWAASSILVGVLLILAEILTAQVVLSQVGNVLVFWGSALAAWLVLEGTAGQRSLA